MRSLGFQVLESDSAFIFLLPENDLVKFNATRKG